MDISEGYIIKQKRGLSNMFSHSSNIFCALNIKNLFYFSEQNVISLKIKLLCLQSHGRSYT